MYSTNSSFFTDSHGRAVNLRGVNLSGSAKLPTTPNLPSHIADDFYESQRTVSFIGRPFPLEEGDEHFARLAHWIEHEGPGVYDVKYLDYIVEILLIAKKYKFRCFMDPHQDVWARVSGGSGAPSWTFKFAGLDINKFQQTAAAILHQSFPDKQNFPKMIWGTNYYKLATSTMFSLFFAGKIFAPDLLIEDLKTGNKVNIEDFLQSHYCNAIAALARHIHLKEGLEDVVVVGYDTLNEPSNGLIGLKDLNQFPHSQLLRKGDTPTPFQTFLLGTGIPCKVARYEFSWAGSYLKEYSLIDPSGVSVWLPVEDLIEGDFVIHKKPGCIWANHGVWVVESQKLLIPNYFQTNPMTKEIITFDEIFKKFVFRFTNAIRCYHKTAVIFIEPPINDSPPKFSTEEFERLGRIVYAPHWYDGLTLVNKHFQKYFNIDFLNAFRGKYTFFAIAIKFGKSGIQKVFRNQFNLIKAEGQKNIGNVPCVIGEVGIPFDLDNKYAYESGDYSQQLLAMDSNLMALEACLMDFTLWTYCPENSYKWGDGWNGEDLSIFCKDEYDKLKSETPNFDRNQLLDAGGRVLDALVRPYVISTPGFPKLLSFNREKGFMSYSYLIPAIDVTQNVTLIKQAKKSILTDLEPPQEEIGDWLELFLPRRHFGEVELYASHGENSIECAEPQWIVNMEMQRAYFKCDCHKTCEMKAAGSVSAGDIDPSFQCTNIVIRRGSKDGGDMVRFSDALIRKRGGCVIF